MYQACTTNIPNGANAFMYRSAKPNLPTPSGKDCNIQQCSMVSEKISDDFDTYDILIRISNDEVGF